MIYFIQRRKDNEIINTSFTSERHARNWFANNIADTFENWRIISAPEKSCINHNNNTIETF